MPKIPILSISNQDYQGKWPQFFMDLTSQYLSWDPWIHIWIARQEFYLRYTGLLLFVCQSRMQSWTICLDGRKSCFNSGWFSSCFWPQMTFFRIRWDIFLGHSVLINISLLVLPLILWDLVHLQPLTDMPFWPNLSELSQSIWNLPAGNLVMSLDEYWRQTVSDNLNFVTNVQK